MIRFRRRRDGAIALAELLVCLGMISLVLGLGGVCFVEVIRLSGAQERYNQRLDASDYLLRRVARDVRAASGFADSAGEFRAGEATLIIRTQDGCIVYRSDEGKVERIELFGASVHRVVVVDAPGVAVHFDHERVPPGEARSVVTTAEWEEPPKIGVSHPVLSLRVACRNSKDDRARN